MASTPTISIVAPVYKVEKYLRDCVESVLAQSFTDFELILVDDSSPDKCGEICDELAKRDSRIRVFHQANGGVVSARKLGVENARGEWINFLDPDDLLPKDALKNLIDEVSDDVDWVQGGGAELQRRRNAEGGNKNWQSKELRHGGYRGKHAYLPYGSVGKNCQTKTLYPSCL